MVNVSGQKIPSWDESLLSAVHVYLTQSSAQSIIYRVAWLSPTCACQRLEETSAFSTPVTQIDISE